MYSGDTGRGTHFGAQITHMRHLCGHFRAKVTCLHLRLIGAKPESEPPQWSRHMRRQRYDDIICLGSVLDVLSSSFRLAQSRFHRRTKTAFLLCNRKIAPIKMFIGAMAGLWFLWGSGGGLISFLCLIHFICDIKWILVYFAVWLRLFFRLCSLVLFEEVPRLTWLICSALNEKGGKGRLCLLEILWLRQLSLAAFTHWSLSKLQFNAACKLECRWLSWQHRQDGQEILEQAAATCCISGDGGPKKEQRAPFS